MLNRIILALAALPIITTPIQAAGGGGKLAVQVRKSPIGPKVHVTMPTNSASTSITGIELPLLGNELEERNRRNFADGHMIRVVTTEPVILYRVYKEPNVLGLRGTWLTNLMFGTQEDAMKNLALLPEWYREFGEPNRVAVVNVPKGTEIYVGNAAPQVGAPPPAPKKKRPLSPAEKLEAARAEASEFVGKKPKAKEVRDFRPGKGGQILVPPTNFLGATQLTLANVEGSFPIGKAK